MAKKKGNTSMEPAKIAVSHGAPVLFIYGGNVVKKC